MKYLVWIFFLIFSLNTVAQNTPVKRPFGTPKNKDGTATPKKSTNRPFGSVATQKKDEDSSYITNVNPRNDINLTLLGDASILSISYGRLIYLTKHLVLSGKVGIGYNEKFIFYLGNGNHPPPDRYLTVPLHITANIGGRSHYLEFGMGGTFLAGNTAENFIPYPIVGYRSIPRKSKTNFRLFAGIPILDNQNRDILFIPFGVSFGANF